MVRDRASTRWAAPGSRHERSIRLARWAIPAAALAVLAALSLAPFRARDEVSFIFDKKSAPQAAEALKVERAVYRGTDDKGQPFTLIAASAAQDRASPPAGPASVNTAAAAPVAPVGISGLDGELVSRDGPVRFTADEALYRADQKAVGVEGAVEVTGPRGFTLNTRAVDIDLGRRTLSSRAPVRGQLDLGRFEAGRVRADLGSRAVRLDGGVRLKINQGAIKTGR